MSDFVRADGARILITFDKPLIGDVTGQEAYFTVTVPEYTYVPGGVIQDVVKAVKSTEPGETENQLILNMEPLQRFESAAGRISVTYDGNGTLAGLGGPVAVFTKSFTPIGLAYKGDQNDIEHIEISNITAAGILKKIEYQSAKAPNEHIEISNITATGILTHVDDI